MCDRVRWVGKGLICFNFRLNYFWNDVSARFVVSALVLLILVTFLLDELDKKVTLQDKPVGGTRRESRSATLRRQTH